ncbi:hypothetical protein [Halpernia sp. GG3]
MGAAFGGVGFAINYLVTGEGTFINHENQNTSYGTESSKYESYDDTNGGTPLSQKEIKNEFKNWKKPYAAYKFKQNVYLAGRGEIPPTYNLSEDGASFQGADHACAVTLTKYQGDTAIRSTIYVPKNIYSKDQLNYWFNHEFGHAVVNHKYGYNNEYNILVKGNDVLMDSPAHIAIEFTGAEFLRINNISSSIIRGAYPGDFIGNYSPDYGLLLFLKKLIIKIK